MICGMWMPQFSSVTKNTDSNMDTLHSVCGRHVTMLTNFSKYSVQIVTCFVRQLGVCARRVLKNNYNTGQKTSDSISGATILLTHQISTIKSTEDLTIFDLVQLSSHTVPQLALNQCNTVTENSSSLKLRCKHVLQLTRERRHDVSPASSCSVIFSHSKLATLKLMTLTAFRIVQLRVHDISFETSTVVLTLLFTSSCIWHHIHTHLYVCFV